MNNITTPTLPTNANVSQSSDNWQGMTLDELRHRRAQALVLREVEKAKLGMRYEALSGDVQSKGVRGLLFQAADVGKLKTVDYILLAFKAWRLIYKLRKRRR